MPYPRTTVSVCEWIAQRCGPGGTTFAVLRQSDWALVGCAGFGDDTRAAEHGYWIGCPSWGLGFATESVRAVVGHLRERGVAALMSHVLLDNPASACALETVGFTYRGVSTGHYPLRGGSARPGSIGSGSAARADRGPRERPPVGNVDRAPAPIRPVQRRLGASTGREPHRQVRAQRRRATR